MNNKEINSSNRKNSAEDEIDINRLFNTIGKGIAKAFKAIFIVFFLFIDTFISNIKHLLILGLMGGVLGVGYFFLVKPYYESSMTLGSIYYRGQFISNSIQNLNALCKEQNYRALTKILKINEAKAKALKGINIEPVVSPNMQLLVNLYKNSEGNKHRLDSLILSTEDTIFQVRVQVYDTIALNGLDTSLVNYIKQNQFVKKRIAVERANLRSRRAKLIKESISLDTLKHNIALSYRNQAGGRSGTNNVILDDKGTNPIEIYREDLKIYEQILDIERLLYIGSEIEIIDSFVAFAEPESGSLVQNALKGILVGLLLFLIYVIGLMLQIGVAKMRNILKEED